MKSVSTEFTANSIARNRHPKARVKFDWNLGDGYQDESAYLVMVEVDRKLIEPLGGVSVAQADITFVNIDDRYTPPGQTS